MSARPVYFAFLFVQLAMLVLGVRPSGAAEPKVEQVTVIRAGRFIDTKNGRVLADQAVVIEGAKVKSVGPASRLTLTPGRDVRFINLPKATVMPGLIDAHSHITQQSQDYYADTFRKSPVDVAVLAHVYARRTLLAGFTTVRAPGAPEYVDIALAKAIDRGDVVGPRIFGAALGIGATGGHADHTGFSPYLSFKNMTGVADGVDAIRKRVRTNIKYGAEWIKIVATAGVLSEEESVGAPQYSLEEMKAAVEEAAMWGKKVAAHAHGTEGIKRAIRAGVASIEHASFIDAEGIALAKQRGTWLVMDIYNDDYILAEFARQGYPAKIIEKERLVGRVQRENFHKAVRAGCKIAYGTDAGVYPHGWNGKQMAHMVRWGMTPMRAVQSATIHAAQLLGRDKVIGQLSPGSYADLIAIDGDPLKDPALFEKVGFVMKNGEIYKNELTAEAIRRLE